MTLERRLMLAAATLGGVVVVGVVGYMIIERWSLLEAAYMTVITLASVGFMEVHPLSAGGRVFTIFLILGGMGTLLYGISSATAFIVEGELKDILRRRKMEKKIAALHGHYIVCGVAGVGRYVVEEMRGAMRQLVVVDEDLRRLEALPAGELLWVQGSPTADGVLRAAGIERAAGLVSALDTDKDNLFLVLTARNLAPQLRIVALAVEEESSRKLRVAGADEVVSANRIGGLRIASVMIRPAAVTFLDRMLRPSGQALRVEELTVGQGSAAAGRRLSEVEALREAKALVLARRPSGSEDYQHNPPADAVLGAGDTLVMMVEVARLEELRLRFRPAG